MNTGPLLAPSSTAELTAPSGLFDGVASESNLPEEPEPLPRLASDAGPPPAARSRSPLVEVSVAVPISLRTDAPSAPALSSER